MVSDADNFEVEFPRMLQKPEHRALLVVATIFMDYMWFEDKESKKDIWREFIYLKFIYYELVKIISFKLNLGKIE